MIDWDRFSKHKHAIYDYFYFFPVCHHQVINCNIPARDDDDLAKFRMQTYLKCKRRGVCNEKCQNNNVNMAAKGFKGTWWACLNGGVARRGRH